MHIYGNIKYIDDTEKVWELLNETTKIYEGQDGWKLPQEEKFKDLTKFIRFFESILQVLKLSSNLIKIKHKRT